MQPLRHGAEGAAVADVRRVLAGLGLLSNLDPAKERTFDTSAELAVRHPYPNPRPLERQALRALLQRAHDGASPAP